MATNKVIGTINGIDITEDDMAGMASDMLLYAAEDFPEDRKAKVLAFISLFLVIQRATGRLDEFIEMANDFRQNVDAEVSFEPEPPEAA